MLANRNTASVVVRLRAMAAALMCSTALVPVAAPLAQAETWNGSLSRNWNLNGNWTSARPDATTTAVINNGALPNQPIIGAGTNAEALTTQVTAGTLTVRGRLTSPQVTVTGVGGLTVNAGGEIVGDLRFDGDSTGEISGTVTGNLRVVDGTVTSRGTVTGIVSVDGDGDLRLTGAGSVAGPVRVTNGRLVLAGGTAVGDAARVTVNGGLLQLDASETIGALVGGAGGTVNLGTRQLTVGGTGDSTTYAGALQGAAGSRLVKTGAGALTLSGAVNTAGDLRVEDGVLSVAGAAGSARLVAGTLTGTGVLALSGGYTQTGGILGAGLTVNAAGDKALGGGTVAGTLGGAGATTVSGGTVDVTGTILGDVAVTSGTLGLGQSGAVSGTISVAAATIRYADGVNEGSALVLTGPGTRLDVAGADSARQSGAISGADGIEKVGTGTLTLSGANSHAGATVVSDGTLVLAGGAAIADAATVTVNGGQLALAGSETVGGLDGIGGTVDLGVRRLTVGGTGADSTYAGTVQGAAGSTLDKVGAGALTLSGTLASGGALRVADGTLNLTGAAKDAGSVRLAAGTLTGTGVLALSGGYTQTGGTLGAGLTVNAAGDKALGGGTIAGTLGGAGATTVSGGTVDVTGTILGDVAVRNSTLVLGQSAAVSGTLTVRGSVLRYGDGVDEGSAIVLDGPGTRLEVLGAGSATQSGAISETGGVRGIEKVGTGTLTLSGPNSHTGATVVSDGTLVLAGGAAIADSARVEVNAGRLDLAASETVGALSGSGGEVRLGAQTLTTGGSGATSSFDGTITGDAGSALVKAGSGRLTLGGPVATAGALRVDGGVLVLSGPAVNAVGGGTVLASGTRLRLRSTEAAGGAAGLGSAITLQGATLGLDAGVANATALTLAGDGSQIAVTAGTATQSGLVGEDIAGRGLTKTGAGTLELTGANTYTGETVVDAGVLDLVGSVASTVVTVRDTAALLVAGASLNDAARVSLGAGSRLELQGDESLGRLTGTDATATVVLNANTVRLTAGTGSFAGSIGGTGGLIVDGADQTLTGASTYSGTTEVRTGRLRIGDGGTTGSLAGGAIIVTGGARLTIDRAGALTLPNLVTGAGTLEKTGSGTLVMTGSNGVAGEFTGTAEVNAGVLQVDGLFGDSAGNTATLAVNAGGTVQGSGTVAGSVAVNAGGTLAAGAGAGSVGTLTIGGGLTLGAGSTTRFDLATADSKAGPGNDGLRVGGAVVLGGTLRVDSAPVQDGYYRLIDALGGVSGSFATVDAAGGTVLTNVVNQVNLRVGAGPAVQFWDGPNLTDNDAVDGGTGTWSATGTNWTIANGEFNDAWLGGSAVFAGAAGAVTVVGSHLFQDLIFDTAGYTLTGGTLVAPTAGGFSNLIANRDATIDSTITGAGGITTSGTGVLTLGGVNSYAGRTDVAQGTLRLTTNGALPTGTDVTVSAGAVLDVNGTAQRVQSLTGAATAQLGLGTGGQLATTGAAATVFAGAVAGDDASILSQEGTGTLTLTGASTMTGTMRATAGTLVLAAGATTTAQVAGAGGTGTLRTSGGALAANAVLATDSAGAGIVLSGSETVGFLGNLTAAGPGLGTIDLAGAGTVLTLTGNANTLNPGGLSEQAGAITGAGGLAVTGGTHRLSGSNSFAGATAVSGGTLELAGGSAIVDGNAVGLTGTGRLRIVDAEEIGSLTGVAGTGLVLDQTLTFGRGGQDSTFAGLGSGAGGLTKLGTGTLTLSGGNTFTGLTDIREGVLAMTGTSAVGGGVSLAGPATMRVSGTATVGGALATGARAETALAIDMRDGIATDRLVIAGDAALDGTIRMDADLSRATDAFDRIDVAGALTGRAVLEFNNIGTSFNLLNQPFNVITYGSDGGFTATATGLPTNGAVLYSLSRGAGALQLQAGQNPAISGVVGGLALTQSLLGSVINRPSSPFVSGLVADDGKPCGVGTWARGIGGKADATGNTSSALGSFANSFDVSYRGLQVGIDRACFGGQDNGWDLSFGAMLGANSGSSLQPVRAFSIDPNGNLVPGATTSLNSTRFQQAYGGVYMTAARGRLFSDLQLRFNRTDFDLTNIVPAGGTALGVNNQRYTSSGQTLSGAVGYAFTLNESTGLSLVPSLGFSLSSTKVGSLRFDNGPGAADDGVLQIDRVKNRVGFASLTLARTRVLPDNRSVLTVFGTATAYNDFAGGTRSTYFNADATGAPIPGTGLSATSDNLGAYGEISLGLNYTRVLTPGQALNARQLDASLRVDGRKGKNVDSWGVTAQVRLQF